jgi:hypothetical protein
MHICKSICITTRLYFILNIYIIVWWCLNFIYLFYTPLHSKLSEGCVLAFINWIDKFEYVIFRIKQVIKPDYFTLLVIRPPNQKSFFGSILLVLLSSILIGTTLKVLMGQKDLSPTFFGLLAIILIILILPFMSKLQIGSVQLDLQSVGKEPSLE